MYRNYYSFSTPKPYLPQQTTKKFAEDIECIIRSANPDSGSLYISNIEAASNPNTLQKLRIGAVLSCAKGYQLSHSPSLIPHYKYIPTEDHQKCDISIHFDEAVDFISEKLRKTNILVHCIAGVSRSVSMVLAYFIREHNMHYDDAYHLVKAKRRIISPNDGFIQQLKEYSRKIKLKTPTKREHADSYSKQRSTLAKSALLLKSTTEKQPNSFGRNNTTTPKRQYGNKEVTLLSEFKSADITAKPTKQQYKPLNQEFKSSEYMRYQTLKERQEKYGPFKTANSFYTPTKAPQHRPYHYDDSRSPNRIDRVAITPNEKRLNGEVTPNKPIEATVQPARGSLYQNMSNDLNQKIELIRKKYDAERQKLYDRYQKNDQNQQTKYNPYNSINPPTQTRGASVNDFRPITRANTVTLEQKTHSRQNFERKEPKYSTNRLSYNYNDVHNRSADQYYPSTKTGYTAHRYQTSGGYDRYENARDRDYNNYTPSYQPNYRKYQYS